MDRLAAPEGEIASGAEPQLQRRGFSVALRVAVAPSAVRLARRWRNQVGSTIRIDPHPSLNPPGLLPYDRRPSQESCHPLHRIREEISARHRRAPPGSINGGSQAEQGQQGRRDRQTPNRSLKHRSSNSAGRPGAPPWRRRPRTQRLVVAGFSLPCSERNSSPPHFPDRNTGFQRRRAPACCRFPQYSPEAAKSTRDLSKRSTMRAGNAPCGWMGSDESRNDSFEARNV